MLWKRAKKALCFAGVTALLMGSLAACGGGTDSGSKGDTSGADDSGAVQDASGGEDAGAADAGGTAGSCGSSGCCLGRLEPSGSTRWSSTGIRQTGSLQAAHITFPPGRITIP